MVLIMSLIEIRSVSKRFGGLAAVSDVDLAVEDGEIHCLIGPNGAGKSTLFKLIVGIYPPTAGSIRFRDVEITRERPPLTASHYLQYDSICLLLFSASARHALCK